MKAYLSFFRIKFINGLQYKIAAYSGVVTQLAWGFMYIMIYEAFYQSNPANSPIEFSKLANYIWLQQSFLALFMTWFLDNDIFDSILSGNVSYEICRPLNIYNMWFAKNLATRVSKVVLRCVPILLVASFMPGTYKFTGPVSFENFILFIISAILGALVTVSYCMLIYIFTFYTTSSMGVRITFTMLADFFSGGIIPLPLLPEYLTKYIYLSPFACMQNTPFMIYIGSVDMKEAIFQIVLQVFWLTVLIIFGKWLMKINLKKVLVQGG